jgi:hypothetical protein
MTKRILSIAWMMLLLGACALAESIPAGTHITVRPASALSSAIVPESEVASLAGCREQNASV